MPRRLEGDGKENLIVDLLAFQSWISWFPCSEIEGIPDSADLDPYHACGIVARLSARRFDGKGHLSVSGSWIFPFIQILGQNLGVTVLRLRLAYRPSLALSNYKLATKTGMLSGSETPSPSTGYMLFYRWKALSGIISLCDSNSVIKACCGNFFSCSTLRISHEEIMRTGLCLGFIHRYMCRVICLSLVSLLGDIYCSISRTPTCSLNRCKLSLSLQMVPLFVNERSSRLPINLELNV